MMKKIFLFLSVMSFVLYIDATIVFNSPSNGQFDPYYDFIYNTKVSLPPSYISRPSVFLVNYSSMPFSITNNTKLGGIGHVADPNGSYPVQSVDQYDGSPIQVASGAIVTPVMADPAGPTKLTNSLTGASLGQKMYWEYYYPNWNTANTPQKSANASIVSQLDPTQLKIFNWSGGKAGWNGYPVVNHKGKTISINKPGYWMFTDIGVFYYHVPNFSNESAAGYPSTGLGGGAITY